MMFGNWYPSANIWQVQIFASVTFTGSGLVWHSIFMTKVTIALQNLADVQSSCVRWLWRVLHVLQTTRRMSGQITWVTPRNSSSVTVLTFQLSTAAPRKRAAVASRDWHWASRNAAIWRCTAWPPCWLGWVPALIFVWPTRQQYTLVYTAAAPRWRRPGRLSDGVLVAAAVAASHT